MTKEKASQLGLALLLWSKGAILEARDTESPDPRWIPFDPGAYEKINVDEGLEWRVREHLSEEFSDNHVSGPLQSSLGSSDKA